MEINPNTLKDSVTNTFRYVAKLGDLDTMGVCAIVPLLPTFLRRVMCSTKKGGKRLS